jgi:hypothetical protein
MDAKELVIVVAGLTGTFCLPWPAQHTDQIGLAVEGACERNRPVEPVRAVAPALGPGDPCSPRVPRG